MNRNPIVAQDAKVTDQRFQTPAVARCADHRIRMESHTIVENHVASFKPFNGAHDASGAAFERSDETIIDCRVAPVLAVVGVDADRGSRDPVGLQVAERHPLHDTEQRVGHHAWRTVAEEDEDGLTRDAENLARCEVGRRAHRKRDLCARLDQVACDIETRVTGTHDQNVPARVRGGARELG